MDDAALLEAGRAVRPYLAEMGLEEALDGELAAALAAADPGRILSLLTAQPATADWLVGFSRTGLPPAVVPEATRSYSPLAGHGEVARARRFTCPVAGDFVWYRRVEGQPIRSCPTHQVRLVPDAP
jgi:hypothetical protein